MKITTGSLADAYKGGGGGKKPRIKGTYRMKCVYSEVVAKRNKPDEVQLKLQWKFDDETPDDLHVYDYVGFDESSRWKLDQLLHALGKYPGPGMSMELDEEDIIGEIVDIDLDVEPSRNPKYPDQEQNKVARYGSLEPDANKF